MSVQHNAEYLISMKVPEVLDRLIKDLLVKRPPSQMQACYEMCNLAGEMYMEMTEETESAADQEDSTVDEERKDQKTRLPNAKELGFLGCGLKRGAILGKGAFGKVYKALDGHGTLYAVKVLNITGASAMDEAFGEYNVLKQLGHKNIVRVWDFHFDPADSTAEIVMSYWTQGSIAHQIMEFGALPMYTVRKYSMQLLDGLGYLHNCHIVHKDLKPQNVLADTTGAVALTDFGLSSCVESALGNTSSIEAVGSPPYMSPNVVCRNEHTPQSDLWAFGCMLLNMSTAKMGWSGCNFEGPHNWGPSAYLYATGKSAKSGVTPITCPNDISSDLPEVFRDFLQQCFKAEELGATHKDLTRHPFIMGKKKPALGKPVKEEKKIPLSGKSIVYLSLDACALPEEARAERLKAVFEGAISTASPFSFTDIKKASAEKGEGFNNTSYKHEKMFGTQKRLAHVLLEKLGRSEDRTQIEPGNPRASLSPSLLARYDEDHEVVINAAEIDASAERERLSGSHPDPEFPGEDGGPSAAEIYGDREFRITIGELKRLVRSAHVETADVLTRRFYEDLVEFTSRCECNPECQLFWSAHRAVPIIHLGKLQEELKLYDVIKSDLASIGQQIRDIETQQETDSDRVLEAKKRDLITKQRKVNAHKACVERFMEAIRVGTSASAPATGNPMARFLKKFDQWRQHVLQFPFQMGFSSAADAKMALDGSLTELCTAVCVSQEGYFLVDGCDGGHNQLAPLPTQPCAFLSATGLDFMSPASTVIEAAKYFERPQRPGVPQHEGWRGFKPIAQYTLKERIKTTYGAILACAQHHGARNLSMLPMGLGMFLKNIHPDDRGAVREAYMEGQLELLCEKDYGVEAYYLNPGPPESWKVAEAVMDRLVASGAQPYCDVVLHSCDAKFLACELSKRGLSAAMLNPSDCASVMIGLIGTRWETLRGPDYSGETDLATCSTIVLARTEIADAGTN